MSTRSRTLTVDDGFTIHYSLQGSGPLMLFITGSSGLGKHWRFIIPHLSKHFICCTYNRRGFSAATLPAQPQHQTFTDSCPIIMRNALDAAALLKHLSPTTPSYVLSTSFGSTIALDLLTRFPGLIHAAVVHEPMLTTILDAPSRRATSASIDAMLRALDTAGAEAGISGFIKAFIKAGSLDESRLRLMNDPRGKETSAKFLYAFRNELPAMKTYEVNVEGLRACSEKGKLVLVAGKEGRGLQPYRATEALAGRIGARMRGGGGTYVGFRSKGGGGRGEGCHSGFER
jgi:pimeloyl-ACP methyl ester carboxylesterase